MYVSVRVGYVCKCEDGICECVYGSWNRQHSNVQRSGPARSTCIGSKFKEPLIA